MKEIIENRQIGRGFEFLRKVDMFGVPIQINYNNESKHTTRIGGIVSLTIFGLLFSYLLNLVLEIQDRSNPSVIQEDLIVTNPAQFNLTDQNFGFAIALLDETYTPFIDPSYYTMSAVFLYKEAAVQADGSIGSDFKTKNIELEPCTTSSFQVPGTQEFFLSQPYQSLYCIKDLNQYYLVGQFDQPAFSVIQIYVSVCTGSICQTASEIQKKLQASQLQIYYSNSIVQVSDIENPFQPVGQSLFWQSNLNQAQVITITYKNTYVIDDIGLISSEYVTKSNLLYSDYRTMYNTNADSYFYYVSIFMEKNREAKYSRKFLKLTQAVSQVGGIYNVLFFFGCMLAQPYSYLELERKLVNSTFSFASDLVSGGQQKPSDDSNKGKKKKKSISCKEPKSENNKPVYDPNFLSPNSISRSEFAQNAHNMQTSYDRRGTVSKKDFIVENKETKVLNHPELSNQNSDQRTVGPLETLGSRVNNQINTTFSEIKIKTSEYFTYYFRCFKCFKNDVQKIMSFGTRKICEFTDITFIVNKLIELEKMKHLLLNEQQLKLFEYIPKPQVTKSILEGYSTAIDQNLKVTQAIKSNSVFQLQQIDNNRQNSDKTSQLNILTIMNRSQLEKAREAQKAFNNIYKQSKKLSKIDQKLLQLLDQNHLPLFNTNQFDSSVFLNMKNYLFKASSNQSQYQESPGLGTTIFNENHKESEHIDQLQNRKSSDNQDQQRSILDELLHHIDKIKVDEITQSPSHNEEQSLPQIPLEDITMYQQSSSQPHSIQPIVTDASQQLQYNFEKKNISKNPFQQPL